MELDRRLNTGTVSQPSPSDLSRRESQPEISKEIFRPAKRKISSRVLRRRAILAGAVTAIASGALVLPPAIDRVRTNASADCAPTNNTATVQSNEGSVWEVIRRTEPNNGFRIEGEVKCTNANRSRAGKSLVSGEVLTIWKPVRESNSRTTPSQVSRRT